jgi:hypothetical protein
MTADHGHGWLLRHRGLGMTLIAYAIANDRVVMAVDSASTYVNNDPMPPAGLTPFATSPMIKMRQVRNEPLAWALCGGMQDIRHFGNWIDAESFSSWDNLAEQCLKKVVDLNRENIANGRASGIDKKDVQQTMAVVGGFVGGVPDVLTVDAYAALASSLEKTWGFVGPYFATSIVSWQTVVALMPSLSLSTPKTMRTFMESMCASMLFLSAPVEVWAITADGCDQTGGDP